MYNDYGHFFLGIVYKPAMKQGPMYMYVNDMFVVNENNRNKRQFLIVKPIFF